MSKTISIDETKQALVSDISPLKAIIIAGPTASGKSALAIDIAEKYPVTIINADSQQVYKELSILSARPSPADEAKVPHRLFGILPASEVCSAGRWLEMVKVEIEKSISSGRTPLLVGGTGLYLKALTDGLSPIPQINPEVREKARALWDEIGPEQFIKRLFDVDPLSATTIAPTDSQRLIRAFEVSLSTGRPFSSWKEEPREMVVKGISFATVQLVPVREVLYEAINARFDKMMEMGAMIEVKNLLKLGLDKDLPAMKALGVPELISHIEGKISLSEALEKAKTASRNYAKRQLTWARHQLAGKVLVIAQYSESSRGKIFSFIDEFMLTENP